MDERKLVPPLLRRFAHLLASDWAYERNVPARTHERFYHRDNHDDEETQMDQSGDEKPEPAENRPDHRKHPKNFVENHRDDVEEKPGASENDRLHRVETNELIVLFQDVKNQAPHERNTGQRRGDVGRQSGGSRMSTRQLSWARSGWWWRRVDRIWHETFRGTVRPIVKANSETALFAFGPRRQGIRLPNRLPGRVSSDS